MADEDIVKEFMERTEQGDIDGAAELLADDFVIDHQAGPQPLNREEWMAAMTAMTRAIPDFRFNAGEFDVEGGKVKTRVKIVGTHENDLDLTPLGLPTAEATGKRIEMPEEDQIAIVEGGKIKRIEVPAVPGGGVPGMLKQIGVEMEGAGGEEHGE